MAEQHENMQQQHHQQGQHITAQILNVQGGVATLGDSTPIQIMMPTGVVNVMDEHQQVPHHVQEMQEVVQEAVGGTQDPPEDPKLTNKKELSKQWKSLCKRAKQWCSMHDDSVPNFVMMYLDENRLVWEGPDHMESFISDEGVISAFLRTAALSESLIGMEKRGADDIQETAQRPAKKQKSAETASTSKKGMTDEEVIASILEKPEAESQDSTQDIGAGGDENDSDSGAGQAAEGHQPSQSTSEGPSQGGEGDVLSQVIESVIKEWAPGQGPPPRTSPGEEEGDGNVPDEAYGIVKTEIIEVPDQKPCVSLIRGSAMSKVGKAAASELASKQGTSVRDVVTLAIDEENLDDTGVKPEFLCACGLVLPSKKLFRQHCLTTHKGPKAFQCQICEKNFVTSQRLKGHMLVHTDGTHKVAVPDGPTRYNCPDCPMKFSLSLALKYHMNKKHGKPLGDSNTHKYEHMYSVLSGNVTCRKCSTTFKTMGELKDHMKTHKPEKKYTCDHSHCGKKFSYRSTLRNHVATHRITGAGDSDGENLGGGELEGGEKSASRRPCVCEQCGKTLSSRRSLKMHKLWVHQGVKPFPCPHCPRQYCQRRDLDHHININHGSAKLLKIEVNRDGRRVVLGRGKHACEICQREFSSRRPLQVHMRIHTGEKPFSCETCNRPFARKSDLVKHSRLHTGEKPYECPVCHKTFRAISNMKLHARKNCRYEAFGPLPPSAISRESPVKSVNEKCDYDIVNIGEVAVEEVYTQLSHQMEDNKDVEHIEVRYEADGDVITEGHVIQHIDGVPAGSYQIVIPGDSGSGGLTTIELQDISQAVASAAEYTDQGRQLVYVSQSLLHEIPSTSAVGTVPEPSTSEIHMAADTIAKIEAIHNAQISREYQT